MQYVTDDIMLYVDQKSRIADISFESYKRQTLMSLSRFPKRQCIFHSHVLDFIDKFVTWLPFSRSVILSHSREMDL